MDIIRLHPEQPWGLVIAVTLLALFAAAVFQPHRIRNGTVWFVAVVLLALALVIPTFSILVWDVDAITAEMVRNEDARGKFASWIPVYLQTTRALSIVSQVFFAGGLITATLSLLPKPQRPMSNDEQSSNTNVRA